MIAVASCLHFSSLKDVHAYVVLITIFVGRKSFGQLATQNQIPRPNIRQTDYSNKAEYVSRVNGVGLHIYSGNALVRIRREKA